MEKKQENKKELVVQSKNNIEKPEETLPGFLNRTFEKTTFSNRDYSKTIFNGSVFVEVTIENSLLKHSEFTEIKLTKSKIENCNLQSSDFVYSEITETIFNNCVFNHCEWRETTFKNVRFLNCSFENSTISLCSFESCEFNSKSLNKFFDFSISYNLFSNCIIENRLPSQSFIERNFGLVNEKASFENLPDELDPLAKLSLNYFTRDLSSKSFFGLFFRAIDKILIPENSSKQRYIRYSIELCKVYVKEKNLSLIGIHFLHHILIQKIQTCRNAFVFSELTALVVMLRSFLFDEARKIEKTFIIEKAWGLRRGACLIYFKENYDSKMVKEFFSCIEDFTLFPAESIKTKFESGSSLLTLLFSVPISIGVFLASINFMLKQIKTTIKTVDETHESIDNIHQRLKALRTEKPSKNEVQSSQNLSLKPDTQKILKILSGNNNYPFFKEADRVINKNGEKVLNLDGEAEFYLIIEEKA